MSDKPDEKKTVTITTAASAEPHWFNPGPTFRTLMPWESDGGNAAEYKPKVSKVLNRQEFREAIRKGKIK